MWGRSRPGCIVDGHRRCRSLDNGDRADRLDDGGFQQLPDDTLERSILNGNGYVVGKADLAVQVGVHQDNGLEEPTDDVYGDCIVLEKSRSSSVLSCPL